MERKIIKTADGSTTIYLPEWDEYYHSKHGALQEAYHVFIRSGLQEVAPKHSGELSILEIGFGTGLNAFISLLEAEKSHLKISYTGVEAFPVSKKELEALNYTSSFPDANAAKYFDLLHGIEWDQPEEVTSFFKLNKKKQFFSEIEALEAYDLVYFDAFGPRVQPNLWTEEIFAKMYRALRDQGVLVTYSAKGSVRRALQAVGFHVERLPGPPGKREMLRAKKVPLPSEGVL